MSLPDQNVEPQIVAGVGQTVFAFAWRCDDPTTVKVWVNDVADGGFAIALNADQTAVPGGTITRAVACLGGEIVTVERTSPKVQTTNLIRYGPFPADTITTMLDRAVMLTQEIAAQIFQRALRIPRSALAKMASFDFPVPVLGRVPTWGDAGGGLFKLINVLQAPIGPQGPAGPAGADGVAGAGISPFLPAYRGYKHWYIFDTAQVNYLGAFTNAPTAYGAGTRTFIAGADRWWYQFSPPAALNGSSGDWWGGAGGWTRLAALPKCASRIRLQTKTTVMTLVSLCGATGGSQAGVPVYVPTLGGTNADTAKFVEVAFDSRVSAANFIYGSGNGVTASWLDTGVPATLTDDFLIILDCSAAGIFAATIINCTTGTATTVSKSTHLPATTDLLGPNIGAINWAGGVNNGVYIEFFYMEQN